MKPVIEKDGATTLYKCPQYRKIRTRTKEMRMCGYKENYCPDCGQRLDWDCV